MTAQESRGRSSDVLTIDEGFRALELFVRRHWELRGAPANELGDLVMFLSQAPDGGPADPALWQDWVDAVTVVRQPAP